MLSALDPGLLPRLDPTQEPHFLLLDCFTSVLAVKGYAHAAPENGAPLDCCGPLRPLLLGRKAKRKNLPWGSCAPVVFEHCSYTALAKEKFRARMP